MRCAILCLALAVFGCKRGSSGSSDAGQAPFEVAVQQRSSEAARAFMVGEIDAATYLAVARQGSALRRLAASDGGWREAYQAGDRDGDLVPDDRDACPDTPRHTPVDERGCTVPVDPASAPDDASVRRALAAFGFPYSPKCAGAPVPQMPDALKFGYDNVSRATVALAVSPVTNQPSGCPVLYEIRVALSQGGAPVNFEDTAFRLIFRAEEATQTTDQRVVFRVSAASTGERLRLYDVNKYYAGHLFRVRAINGGGLVSSFSPFTASPVSFGEP